MKISTTLIGTVAVLCLANSRANIKLIEWGINQDSVISGTGNPLPPASTFDTGTGLGIVRLTFAGAGLHSGIFFVDHDMSEAVNSFFNELGEANGVPSPGVSWEIDEPGYVFGDIFENFLAEALDNSAATFGPEDVSMALGWSFLLNPGEQGTLDFLLADTAPAGFHLRQFDPDSSEEIFFSASLTISSGIPDAGPTLVLLLAGCGALSWAGVKRRA